MASETTGGVVKIVELVGSSPNSFSDAVRNAVRTASQTIRNISGVDVLSSSAEVGDNGNLINYKVNCKIAFLVESGPVHDEGSTGGTRANADADDQAPFGAPPPVGGGTSPTGPS